MMEFSERLFLYRAKHGLSLRNAAKTLGVSWRTIQRWERGETPTAFKQKQVEMRMEEMP